MQVNSKPGYKLVFIPILLLLTSCSTTRPDYGTSDYINSNFVAYRVEDREDDFYQYAPVFITAENDKTFNRIGMPMAEHKRNGGERIFVNPDEAVVFVERQHFTTARSSYTNLIYRIHFEKTPFSLLPFNLTAGDNNGLLAVVTLDANKQPLLLTTVHTCGCYLAFTPTSLMPESLYPEGWSTGIQEVYGMFLPGLLELSAPYDAEQRLVIFLQAETHRVMDIDVQSIGQIRQHNPVTPLEVASVDDLMTLPLADSGSTTSFFETGGPRKGYVKGSYKPFERLFVSWWALDWRVGQDKAYGNKSETGTVFYTSLKPWYREESDMWPFADFLEFWGWNL